MGSVLFCPAVLVVRERSLGRFRLGSRLASTNEREKRNQTIAPRRARWGCRAKLVPLSSKSIVYPIARAAGVVGSVSPYQTQDLRFPPRRGIVRNSSTSWLNHRCLGGAGRAGSSAFLATHNLRTIQRIGRDAASCDAKTERGSFPTKQACRKSAPLPEHRFATRYRSEDTRSVFRLRRASRPYPLRGTMPRTIYRS